MTVNINKPQINLREQLKKLERPTTDKLAVKGHDGVLLDPLTGELNLQGIDSGVGGNATDVFVYDTSKDSDGGAWRKRTQSTSWYNETLNTATRGSRKEFPAVAVIVADATTDKVTIYDGDDSDLPMWMVFSAANPRGILGWPTLNITRIKVAALNGILATATNDGGHLFKFIEDFVEINYGSTNYPVTTSRTIGGRNEPAAYVGGGGATRTNVVRTYDQNDVAMTVLPNAPIDSATGLPIPTIAVATQSGVSVIKDDGTVVDITSTLGGNYNQSKAITITEENYLWWLGDYYGGSTSLRDSYAVSLDNFPTSDFTWANTNDNLSAGTFYALTTNNEAGEIRIGSGNTWAWNHQERNALGGPAGLAIHKPNIGSESNSLIAAITSDYNTGYMHGDCKGAFLSDTDTTNVEELITNGTFDSDTTGWTSHNGATITHTTPSAAGIDTPATDGRSAPSSAGIIKIVSNGGASGAYQAFTTIVGKTYTASFLAYQVSYGSNYVYIGTTINGNQNFDFYDEWDQSVNNNWASGSATFTATATTTYITLVPSQVSGRVLYMDEIRVHLAEEDRSVKNNGLTVYGTITKTPVATGAELVAYSGFSNSNYLRQPYNADMQAGTGEISISAWFKSSTSDTSNYKGLFYLNIPGSLGSGLQIMLTPSNGLYFYVYGASASQNFSGSHQNGYNNGTWHQILVSTKPGQQQVYLDGILKDTGSVNTGSLTNTSSELHIGRWNGNAVNSSYWWRGDIALVRVSRSIPSAEQVKKMYEDEKCLFQENAKATLYGSSDAVTALAYDSTTSLLHVGTSGGRSTFSGLKRVENTTTAVTTAISASNGLVAEQ